VLKVASRISIILVSLFVLFASAASQPHKESKHTTSPYSGHIDQTSLDSGLASPTITGTFSGAGGVGIVIVSGKRMLPKRGFFSDIKYTVDYGFSDHGGDVDVEYTKLTPRTYGRFSYTIEDTLKTGTYTVGEYVFGGGWSRSKLVATAILKVR
jgi:hypothetical protein